MSKEVPGRIYPVTVSELSGLSGPRKFRTYLITDGDHQGDTATGSGSEVYLVYHDGSNWRPVGWVCAIVSLTISSNSIALPSHSQPQGWYIDITAGSNPEDLNTITGGVDGDLVWCRSASSSLDPILKHSAGGTGQIFLSAAADQRLDTVNEFVHLVNRGGTVWIEPN